MIPSGDRFCQRIKPACSLSIYKSYGTTKAVSQNYTTERSRPLKKNKIY